MVVFALCERKGNITFLSICIRRHHACAEAPIVNKMAKAASTLVMRLVSAVTTGGSNAVKYTKPRLQTFWTYSKVELRPPTLGEMPQVQEGFNNLIKAARTGKWKQLTVKEAWLNTLIGMEIMFCFFIGEVIGRRNIVGYYIPGAVHYDVTF